MRLFVRVCSQNAPFRRVRFSSPGQTRRSLTEKRTLSARLTKKRTLCAGSHAHCAFPRGPTRRVRFYVRSGVQSVLLREGDTPRVRLSVRWRVQSAPFREVRRTECAFPWSASFLTWANAAPPHGKAHSVCASHQKAHSMCGQPRTLRLSARSDAQSVLFREGDTPRVRLSVRPDSKPRSAGPRATRPAAWRGVARAHLPSWAVSHSAPQPGGGVAPHLPGAAT